MPITDKILEIIHPVRCACGRVFDVDSLNTYVELKPREGHLGAAVRAGFRKKCCQMVLVSPQQIVAQFVAPDKKGDCADCLIPTDFFQFKYHPLLIKVVSNYVSQERPRALRIPLPPDLPSVPMERAVGKGETTIPPVPKYTFPTPWEASYLSEMPRRVIVMPRRDPKEVMTAEKLRAGKH